MLLCQCLYAKRNMRLYEDHLHFEVVTEAKDHATAKKVALDMLYDRAKDTGVQTLWKGLKGKGPPVTFCLPKNKMLEENNELKARILFSYYRHRHRYHARLVGRCLTLMLKLWKSWYQGLKCQIQHAYYAS